MYYNVETGIVRFCGAATGKQVQSELALDG